MVKSEKRLSVIAAFVMGIECTNNYDLCFFISPLVCSHK